MLSSSSSIAGLQERWTPILIALQLGLHVWLFWDLSAAFSRVHSCCGGTGCTGGRSTGCSTRCQAWRGLNSHIHTGPHIPESPHNRRGSRSHRGPPAPGSPQRPVLRTSPPRLAGGRSWGWGRGRWRQRGAAGSRQSSQGTAGHMAHYSC